MSLEYCTSRLTLRGRAARDHFPDGRGIVFIFHYLLTVIFLFSTADLEFHLVSIAFERAPGLGRSQKPGFLVKVISRTDGLLYFIGYERPGFVLNLKRF